MSKIFEIQEKIKNVIVDYDKIVKHNVHVEAQYNENLHDLIQQTLVYEGQCHVFEVALNNKDKDIEEVRSLVRTAQENLFKQLTNYVNKVLNFKRILENTEKNSEEDILKMEEDFFTIVNEVHPSYTLTEDEKVRKGFGILRNLYIENDVDQYYALKKEIPFVKFESTNEEEEINRLSTVLADYEEERARIEKFYENFKELEEINQDDMLIAKQESMLRERIYAAKNNLKVLAENCDSVFGGQIDFSYSKENNN